MEADADGLEAGPPPRHPGLTAPPVPGAEQRTFCEYRRDLWLAAPAAGEGADGRVGLGRGAVGVPRVTDGKVASPELRDRAVAPAAGPPGPPHPSQESSSLSSLR